MSPSQAENFIDRIAKLDRLGQDIAVRQIGILYKKQERRKRWLKKRRAARKEAEA